MPRVEVTFSNDDQRCVTYGDLFIHNTGYDVLMMVQAGTNVYKLVSLLSGNRLSDITFNRDTTVGTVLRQLNGEYSYMQGKDVKLVVCRAGDELDAAEGVDD